MDVHAARLAERQHGVVSRAQLVALGLGPRSIERRVESGRFHLLHRSVYAVGHRNLSNRGHWMAAVLAGGEGATLSHRSGAALLGVRHTARARVEVTIPRSRRSRAGIDFYKAALRPDEVTVVDGIPVTTVSRTLLDLAAVVGRRELERAMNEAEVLQLGDSVGLPQMLTRYPGRRGVAALRAILDEADIGSTITRSQLEERFLAFVDRYGLPRPICNQSLILNGREFQPDGMWPEHRLIVELDSRTFHDTSAAFEDDRERDRILQAAGWRVIRVTWRQLRSNQDRLAGDLRRLLAGYPSPP